MEEETKKEVESEVKEETTMQGFYSPDYKENFKTRLFDDPVTQMITTLNDTRFNDLDKRLSVLEAKFAIIEKVFVK